MRVGLQNKTKSVAKQSKNSRKQVMEINRKSHLLREIFTLLQQKLRDVPAIIREIYQSPACIYKAGSIYHVHRVADTDLIEVLAEISPTHPERPVVALGIVSADFITELRRPLAISIAERT